jgi:hypothetical protein
MTHTTLILALGATLLAGAAQANSIESQRNAELAFCMNQTNATAGETNKSALEGTMTASRRTAGYLNPALRRFFPARSSPLRRCSRR